MNNARNRRSRRNDGERQKRSSGAKVPLPWSKAGRDFRAARQAGKNSRGLRAAIREDNKHKTTKTTEWGIWVATLYLSSVHGDVEEEDGEGVAEDDEKTADNDEEMAEDDEHAAESDDQSSVQAEEDNGDNMLVVEEPTIDSAEPSTVDVVVGANIQLEFTPSPYIESTRSIRLIQFKRPIKPDRLPDDAPYFAKEPTTKNTTTVDRWNVGAPNATPFRIQYSESRHKEVGTVEDLLGHVRGLPLEWFKREEKEGEKKEEPIVLASSGSAVGMGGRVVKAHTIDTPREPTKLREGEERKAVFTVYAYDDDNKVWLGGVSWGYSCTLRGHNIIPRLHRLATRVAAGRLHPDENWARTRWNRECANTAEQVPPDNEF